ncbi:BMP family protein [Pseudoroseicyclus sp. H15]
MLNRRTFVSFVALVAAQLSSTAAVAQTETHNVGVLIPGSTSDKGWMESGYDGLVAAQAEHGDLLKVQMIENISDADMEQALTQLAMANDLVIGVGGQTQQAVFKIAARFPDTSFSIVGGNEGQEAPNVAGYDVKQAEIAFVAGAAAALMSETGAVSYVGGAEIPSIVNAGEEFGAGARYINPDIRYFEAYTGDFDDVAGSKEATLAAINQGADVHYHILNLGLRGMEQAAAENGTHIIGSYSDYCGVDPLYIAYSITGVGYQVEYAIDQLVEGTWEPGYKPFGLAMGSEASDMVVCNSDPEVEAELEEIMQKLLAGDIETLEG